MRTQARNRRKQETGQLLVLICWPVLCAWSVLLNPCFAAWPPTSRAARVLFQPFKLSGRARRLPRLGAHLLVGGPGRPRAEAADDQWNGALLGCGVARLLLCLVRCRVSARRSWCCCCSTSGRRLVYVSVRNRAGRAGDARADAAASCASWPAAICKLKLEAGRRRSRKRRFRIRFIGKSAGGRRRTPTASTAPQDSRGYQAALEMVYEAMEQRTTDIHLEPTKEEMTVRFRIDGILQAAEPVQPGTWATRSSTSSRCWPTWTSPKSASPRTAASPPKS